MKLKRVLSIIAPVIALVLIFYLLRVVPLAQTHYDSPGCSMASQTYRFGILDGSSYAGGYSEFKDFKKTMGQEDISTTVHVVCGKNAKESAKLYLW